MGFLKDLFQKEIGNAISKAVENAIKPETDKITSAVEKHISDVSEQINTACENASTNADQVQSNLNNDLPKSFPIAEFEMFPKWTYSKINDTISEDYDEHYMFGIVVTSTNETIDKYHDELKTNGFTGDWQIMRKTVNGREYIVDFSFVEEGDSCEINYLIKK